MRIVVSILLLFLSLSARGASWFLPSNGSEPAAVGGDFAFLTNQWNQALTLTRSGTPGNPITYVLTNGASFVSSNFANGCIYLNNANNIVIDGLGSGYMRNTNNGEGMPSVVCYGIYGTGTNIVIQNFTMTNIYQRLTLTNYLANTSLGGNGVNLTGSQLTVSNCNIGQVEGGISLYPTPGTLAYDFKILSNNVVACNHFLNTAIGYENTIISNLDWSGNYCDHADYWDGRAADGNLHMDIVYATDSAVGGNHWTNSYIQNWKFRNNTFWTNVVTDLSKSTNYGFANAQNGTYTNSTGLEVNHGNTSMAALYFSWNQNEIRGGLVCNNLIGLNTTNSWSNGFGLVGTNILINNNTFWGGNLTTSTSPGAQVGGSSVYFYNNLLAPGSGIAINGFVTTTNFYNDMGQPTNVIYVLTNFLGTAWSDYNCYPNDGNFGANKYSYSASLTISSSSLLSPQNPAFNLLSLWQNYLTSSGFNTLWSSSHADPHSTTNVPTMNGYVPAANDLVLVGKGTNLNALATALGFTEALSDANGVFHPTTLAWTIGAFEVNTNAAAATTYFLPIRNF